MRVRTMSAAVAVAAVLGLTQFPIAADAEGLTAIRQPNNVIEVRNADGSPFKGDLQFIMTKAAAGSFLTLEETELTTPPTTSPTATAKTDAGEPPVADAKEPAAVEILRHSNGFIELHNTDGSPFLGDVEVVAALIGGKTYRFLMEKDGNPSAESSPAKEETKEAKTAGNGRYQVSGGEMPVMVDTATGQSWVLVQFGKNLLQRVGDHEIRNRLWWTWIPTRRVDDFEEAKMLIELDRRAKQQVDEENAKKSIRGLPRDSQPEKK